MKKGYLIENRTSVLSAAFEGPAPISFGRIFCPCGTGCDCDDHAILSVRPERTSTRTLSSSPNFTWRSRYVLRVDGQHCRIFAIARYRLERNGECIFFFGGKAGTPHTSRNQVSIAVFKIDFRLHGSGLPVERIREARTLRRYPDSAPARALSPGRQDEFARQPIREWGERDVALNLCQPDDRHGLRAAGSAGSDEGSGIGVARRNSRRTRHDARVIREALYCF